MWILAVEELKGHSGLNIEHLFVDEVPLFLIIIKAHRISVELKYKPTLSLAFQVRQTRSFKQKIPDQSLWWKNRFPNFVLSLVIRYLIFTFCKKNHLINASSIYIDSAFWDRRELSVWVYLFPPESVPYALSIGQLSTEVRLSGTLRVIKANHVTSVFSC